MLLITGTPEVNWRNLQDLLAKHCPDLDYEIVIIDMKFSHTLSQKPGERIIVQNSGNIADLYLTKKAIICCGCVADTTIDVICRSYPQHFLCRDLIILPRKLWVDHDPSNRVIRASSLSRVATGACDYDIPLIYNPSVVPPVDQLYIGWGRKENAEYTGPIEAYLIEPKWTGELLQDTTESVVPDQLDVLNTRLSRLHAIL